MLDKVSPNKPENVSETSRYQRVKPEEPPRNDKFRKTYRQESHQPIPKEEEEIEGAEEKDDSNRSVFDLSKKSKAKNKSTSSSSSSKQSALKESSSTEDQRLSFKQGANQDQDLEAYGNEEGFETNVDNPIEPDHQFTAEEAPVTDNLSDIDQPQEMPAAQPKVEGEIKNLKNPRDQANSTNQLNQQQAAILQQSETKKSSPLKSSGETKKSSSVSKKGKSKSETPSKIKEGQKKEDTAGVNASLQSVAFQTEKSQETQEIVRSTIKDLAAQIVDRIQIMRREDQTSTIITLRHPPLLEGATITLTTSDHAKREFNISFANLSPDAKLLLDRKLKEDSLTETLERKGIIVHMLTTSTEPENLLKAEAGAASRDRHDQQQQREQQQKQKKREEEEEDI
jgi:hypothetical protein